MIMCNTKILIIKNVLSGEERVNESELGKE